jgi:uncharacterized protein (TIGR02145 family)
MGKYLNKNRPKPEHLVECDKTLMAGWHSIFAFFVVAALTLFACSGDDGHEPTPPSSSSVSDGGSSSSAEEILDGNRCGSNPQTYNPDLYECKPAINPSGIYLKQKPRDAEGNEYEAVLIGTQVWMAENLNLAKDRDGKDIGRCFEDNPANCEKYGRMYILAEHGTDPDLGGGDLEGGEFGCPEGWRLPSSEDLTKLLKYIDPSHKEGSEMTGRGDNSAGTKLKAKSGWPSDYKGENGNGTDDYGFNALPGGYCGAGCGIYEKTGEPTWSMLYPPVAGSAATSGARADTSSFWWTTSKGKPVPLAITWRISSGITVDDAFQSYSNSRFYARCLKDAEVL